MNGELLQFFRDVRDGTSDVTISEQGIGLREIRNGKAMWPTLAIYELNHWQAPPRFEPVVGGGDPRRPIIAIINFRNREISVNTSFDILIQPLYCALLRQLAEIGIFDAFTVIYSPASDEIAGTLKSVARTIKNVRLTAPIWPTKNLGPDDPAEQEYDIWIGKLPADQSWFHATRASNMRSIRQYGLMPSGLREQGRGWTQLNFDLQAGVYLTDDPEYVGAIACTLKDRFDEPAVILEIAGAALTDTSKLLPDEDAFRDHSFDYMINYGRADSRFPAFFASWASKIRSIAFMGRIPTRYVSIARGGRIREC